MKFESIEDPPFLSKSKIASRAIGRSAGTVKSLTDDADVTYPLFNMYTESCGRMQMDRRWCLGCRPTGGRHINCYWTPHYVNDWDKFFSFQCNNYGFIVGMQSIHHNHYEDRRFRFQCCSIAGKDLSQCRKTFRNDLDKPNTVHVPTGSVVRGVSSSHNNHYEDRQYSWNICKLVNREQFSII
ncbi:unnamed protein product [Mytilus edulis]|uniref:Uncharacterized protein n=1 Tax=Mytilus edulis TaxID=6550 RepID=A0A8S3RTQ4_MYTED|nr:unnamed protein product [Mytilus edulis]